MKEDRLYHFLFLLLILIFPLELSGQTWKFVKEKDGIKIYSRQESGKNLKSFKGVTELKESAEKVIALLDDINNKEWWDKNLSQIKVLLHEKNKHTQYYLVYKMPWPFKNRDLCVDASTSVNPETGELKITSVPLTGSIPPRKGLVRIKDYRQVWTVRPAGKNLSYIELEFYVDPSDNLPDWLVNTILTDSPVKSIEGVRETLKNMVE